MSDSSFVRENVEFLSGLQKDKCRGWLYVPANAKKVPIIVMAHGIGATKELRLDAFAERFVEKGYACLVFDYRHFGESDGLPRQLLDINLLLEDWNSAISHARQIDFVDMTKIILWGTSFSGGHVLHIAARDYKVAAVIAQCPFTNGFSSAFTNGNLRSILGVSKLAILDAFQSLFLKNADPVTVSLVAKPGEVGLMTAPGAEEGYNRMIPNSFLSKFQHQVSARIGLNILFYRPGKDVSKIQCPILFCLCEKDTETPMNVSKQYAVTNLKSEVLIYPCGHFDVYLGEFFTRTIQDQLHFLAVHVPTKNNFIAKL